MSKALSLKLKDDVFIEAEEIIKKIDVPRNAYINEALSFYNKFNRRKLLKKQLKKESELAKASSMEVLSEFEELEDSLF